MGTKKGKGKDRLDKFYKLAKEQGLRARSAFKLVQLNKKFGFLQKARTLLDLGAAPGGWLQIAQKHMTIASTILGVDLMPIKPIPGVKCIAGDFLTDKVKRDIRKEFGNKKCDVVLHDGAPNVSGAWDKDAFVQNVLVLTATKLACEFLTKGGVFVTKIFRSPDYNKLMFVLKELFEKTHATKPESSRFTSAEIFVVCVGFKAPKTIDPKFFNPKYIFADLEAEKEATQGLTKDKTMKQLSRELGAKKHRPSGYDATGLLLYKKMSITEWINSDDYTGDLRNYNEITFDEDGTEDRFKMSPHTNPLLLDACKDLKQINMWTAKKLIQWRGRLVKEENTRLALERGEGVEETEEVELDSDAETDSDKELEELKGELKEIHSAQERKLKKSRKKMTDRKLRQATFGYNKEDNPHDTTGGEASLFDLQDNPEDLEAKLKTIGTEDFDENFDIRADADVWGHENKFRSKQVGEDNKGVDLPFEDEDSDEEEEDDADDESDDHDGPEDQGGNTASFYDRMEAMVLKKQGSKKRKRSDDAEDKDMDGVATEVPGEHMEEDEDIEEEEDDMFGLDPLLTDNHDEAMDSSSSSDEASIDSQDRDWTSKKRKKSAAHDMVTKSNKVAPSGYEKLPDSMKDPLKRAKIHAMASKMLDRRDKRELLEAAVNRHCFNDEDLPDWFAADQRRACFRHFNVTKEDVEMEKARFRSLNARPGKKVMQAIGRKRLRAKRVLSKLAEKEKADPTKSKKGLPTLRMLMRSNKMDQRKINKKGQKLDPKTWGEKHRNWQKMKKEGKVKGSNQKKKK